MSDAVRALHDGGRDYVAKANDEIVVMAIVETKEGLKACMHCASAAFAAGAISSCSRRTWHR